jgi:hypothetical protein
MHSLHAPEQLIIDNYAWLCMWSLLMCSLGQGENLPQYCPGEERERERERKLMQSLQQAAMAGQWEIPISMILHTHFLKGVNWVMGVDCSSCSATLVLLATVA